MTTKTFINILTDGPVIRGKSLNLLNNDITVYLIDPSNKHIAQVKVTPKMLEFVPKGETFSIKVFLEAEKVKDFNFMLKEFVFLAAKRVHGMVFKNSVTATNMLTITNQ